MNETKKTALPVYVWKLRSLTKTFLKRRAERNNALDNLKNLTHWAFNNWNHSTECNNSAQRVGIKSDAYSWLTR